MGFVDYIKNDKISPKWMDTKRLKKKKKGPPPLLHFQNFVLKFVITVNQIKTQNLIKHSQIELFQFIFKLCG